MKQFLGLWCFGSHRGRTWKNEECAVYVDNGVFRLEKRKEYSRHCDWVKLKGELGERYFGDRGFLMYMDYSQLSRLLKEFNGKSDEEVKAVASRFVERKKIRAEKRAVETKKWKQLNEKFGGYVISIERTADIYETGFSVRVLMKTEKTFEERKRFIKENGKDLILWAMNEITECPKIMSKIGDIRYYKPVEIVTMRIPETEIKFEVKGELA